MLYEAKWLTLSCQWVSVLVYVSTCLNTYVHVCVHMRVCVCVCVCVRMRACVCMHVCVCVCVRMHEQVDVLDRDRECVHATAFANMPNRKRTGTVRRHYRNSEDMLYWPGSPMSWGTVLAALRTPVIPCMRYLVCRLSSPSTVSAETHICLSFSN